MSKEKETPKAEIPNAHLHRTINGLDENGEKTATPEPEVQKERELPNQHLHNLHNGPMAGDEKVKPGIAFEKDLDGKVIDKKPSEENSKEETKKKK